MTERNRSKMKATYSSKEVNLKDVSQQLLATIAWGTEHQIIHIQLYNAYKERNEQDKKLNPPDDARNIDLD